MIAQMAATAGSVAIGSTIGHGLSSMLFGGSSAASSEPAQQAAAAPVQQQNQGISCEIQAKGNVQLRSYQEFFSTQYLNAIPRLHKVS